MATVNDEINRVMVLIGSLAPGESVSPDEATDVFNTLNEMLDEWNTERLNIPSVDISLFNLAANQQTYEIGPGGADFNVARPSLIQTASIVLNSLRHPLDLITSQQWAALRERALTGILPQKLYYDAEFPIAHLNFWPRPSGTPQVELTTWDILEQFVALTDTFSFPPGYAKAIRYNLAVNIAPEFGRTLPADGPNSIPAIAIASKAAIRQLNAQPLMGQVSEATRGDIPEEGIPQAEPVGPGAPGQ